MKIGSPEFLQISIVDSILRSMNPSTLQACNRQDVYCNDKATTFLSSAYP